MIFRFPSLSQMGALSLVQFAFFGLLLLSGLGHAYIEAETIDKGLYNCLEMETRNMTVEDYPAAGIMHSCVQSFLASTTHLRYHSNITSEEVAWVSSLVRKYASKRHKRQTGVLRIRQEIRRLTDPQRVALFQAFNVLKQNGRYDTLASFHQNMAITSGHNGPNFLGWHRVYLLALEEALMEVNPSVTLPYWDSSIDFDMNDPIRSIVWSSQFFGNGDGVVNTGPFTNWVVEGGGLLTRNIASFGTSLMQKRLINNIINPNNNIRFHWQMIVWYGQRPWLRQNVLERQHDGVHAWVGGLMRGLSTSAHDPVFFFHHCFIDYLWEQFRLKQRNLGIDSSNDYLPDFYLRDRPAHFRNRLMDGFPDYRNIDGYSDRFTRDIYGYERSPVCPNCGSPYLFCDVRRGVCVPVDPSAIGEARASFGGVSVASLAAQAQGPLALGETFTSSFADPRARNTPLPAGPRADGAGSAFGAFTDGGTGTATNLATSLLRTSSARGQANANVRTAMMSAMNGNQGHSQAQTFRGLFNINQAAMSPIQHLRARQGVLPRQVPHSAMGTFAQNVIQANAQNRMQAMNQNGMPSMSQNSIPTMFHSGIQAMPHTGTSPISNQAGFVPH
ncbi:tyrosinase-like protein [Pecten maximus]|uniref:tyrosinase-like protein n=1 Tax=Pecten maximus TaxID=6579 RepID=UPI001458F0C9|nr:tyrosinase-like protein [Pecten maximus]